MYFLEEKIQSEFYLFLGLSQSSRASSNTSLNKMPSNGEDSSTSSTVSCGSNVSLPSQEHYSNNGIKSVVNPQIQVLQCYLLIHFLADSRFQIFREITSNLRIPNKISSYF